MRENMKVLGLGSPLVDILVHIEDDFLNNIEGDKGGMEYVDVSVIEDTLTVLASDPEFAPGGSSANTILALAKLGVSTGFLGKIGNDSRGRFYTDNYSASGGDIRQFKISDTVNTGRCLSLVTPDSERTMRTFLGAAASIVPEDILTEDFIGYTHFHVEGYMVHNHAVIEKAMRMAKEAGLTVCLDLASFEVVRDNREFLEHLLASYVDIVFTNEDEASQYVASESTEDIFELLDGMCDIIVLKLGKKGAVIKAGDIKVIIGAKIVSAIDTTGAGDLWQAGFLYGLLSSKELSGKLLEKAGGFGAVLGAEVVQVMGASLPDKRWKELKTILK